MKSHVAPCVIAGVLCIMSILGKSVFNLNQISTNILFLGLIGLFCGLLSHLILDLCTAIFGSAELLNNYGYTGQGSGLSLPIFT